MIVATWNVGDGPDATKARGLAALVKRGADVLGLQECGDRGDLLEEFCARTGWDMWPGVGPGAASVPILWNPRTVRKEVAGTMPATPPTHVGRPGAGPDTMKAKVWNRARFISISESDRGEFGTPFVFINGHIVPSVYLPPRRRLARRQVDVLAGVVRRRKGRVPIVAVGDFNMAPGHPLARPLRELGMTQRTRSATHGRRLIDHTWTLGVSGVASVVDMPSDHRAVLLTLKESR